jgi:transcriptional regulator
MAESLPVMRGTLDLLVLKALSWTPMHGFEITSWLEERSQGVLGVEDSAIYQALYRMEKRGWVRAEWGVTENKRRARYYRLTALGREQLETETARLLRYGDVIEEILTYAPRTV